MVRIIKHTLTARRGSIALCAAAMLLVSCNASLETVIVTVDHEEDAPVALRLVDLGRRRSDAESFVVPRSGDRDAPFRYRVARDGDGPLTIAAGARDGGASGLESPALTVVLEGDVAGGVVDIAAGEQVRRFHIDRIVAADATYEQFGRYHLVLPIPNSPVGPWEVEFIAAADSRGFHVRELHFSSRVPRFTVEPQGSPGGGAVYGDARMPVAISAAGVELTHLAAVVRDHTDGIRIWYTAEQSLFGDRATPPAGEIILSDLAIGVALRPGERSTIIRPLRYRRDAEGLAVTLPEGARVTAVEPVPLPGDPLEPVLIDLEELQQWPRELWRREEFGLFSWVDYPRILWTDHLSYDTQSAMFTRLAFFVEKRGFRGRLLTDEELAGRHGWNAHNYRPEGLADFFNTAERTDFLLNSAEEELLRIIVANRLLVEDPGAAPGSRWLPGSGGILSISQGSFPALRRLLTVHEAMHGVFYEEPRFREMSFNYWDNVLNPRERDFWEFFFSWMTYDPDDRYLMVNEFQSYILQQEERATNWYFGTQIAGRLRSAVPARVESINRFLADHPRTFTDAAAAFNQSLFEIAGMRGGDPFGLRLPR